jgi:signal transduction histidine kinase
MMIAGDRARLKRALIHLVANGLSFAGSGEVVVTATRGRDGRARINVRDHGPGFSADALARASQPFARARDVERAEPRAGVGVGLAVARHMLELHGGALAIASRAGRGATVTATLPGHRVGRVAAPAGLRH